MPDVSFLRRQGSTDSSGPCRADQSGIDGEKSGLSTARLSGSRTRFSCIMPRTKKRAPVKIALIQMKAGEDPDANLENAVIHILLAAMKGAQIVCLQELFRSRYFCQSEDHRNFKLAESIPGPSTGALSELAREKEIVI